jgi:hypothetical protein
VWFTEIRTPITAADGQDGELGDDDGGADRGRDFLARFDAQSNVSFAVADDHDGLEARALTGAGLLLHGLDLYKIPPLATPPPPPENVAYNHPRSARKIHTFITSSFNFGKNQSTI